MLDLAEKFQETRKNPEAAAAVFPESRFYSTIFNTIVALHEQEYLHIKAKVSEALSMYNYVNAPITVESQEYFRHLKNTIANILVKVRCCDCFFNGLNSLCRCHPIAPC